MWIRALESTLLDNLGTNGFTLKLAQFWQVLSITSRASRKIPFAGETILTYARRTVRFVNLGALRQSDTRNTCHSAEK
jgi:hypothetical protein